MLEEDEGQYECQVSTEQKLSQTVHLAVVVPEVNISYSFTFNLQSLAKFNFLLNLIIWNSHPSIQRIDNQHILKSDSTDHSNLLLKTSDTPCKCKKYFLL